MPPSLEERRPTMSPQLARRVAILGGFAFVLFAALFFRLWFLQVLSGEDYVSQAAQNRVRKVRIEAPRGDIVDRYGKTLVKTRQAAVVQILPSELPESEREIADAYGSRVSAAERARLAAGDQLRTLERRWRTAARGRKGKRRLTAAQRNERRRDARLQAGPRRRRAADAGRPEGPDALHAPRPHPRGAAAHDPPARDPAGRADALRRRHDQDRRRLGRLQLPQGAPGPVPRRQARDPVPARLPVQDARRPAVRHPARNLAGRAQAQALPRRRPGHADRQGRGGGDLRPLPARHGRLLPPGRRRARAPVRRPRALSRPPRQARAGPAGAPDHRPVAAARRAAGGERGVAAASINGAQAGAFVAMDPRNGEVLALGSVPELRREPVRQADQPGALRPAQLRGRAASRCSTGRSRASIRPARPSS